MYTGDAPRLEQDPAVPGPGADAHHPDTENPEHTHGRFLTAIRTMRDGLERKPKTRLAYRIAIAFFGSLVVLIGVVLIPLPGPGWLIVFLGLAILGTEFAWAHRLLLRGRRILARAREWWTQRRAASRARKAARQTATSR
jgi:uncharacterized protein (TIGR02611 family)